MSQEHKVRYYLDIIKMKGRRIIDFVMCGSREDARIFDRKGTVQLREGMPNTNPPLVPGEIGWIAVMKDPSEMDEDSPKFLGVKFFHHDEVIWLSKDDVYGEEPPAPPARFAGKQYTNLVNPPRSAHKCH